MSERRRKGVESKKSMGNAKKKESERSLDRGGEGGGIPYK
jgi:hypothetical protein